jgi:uncharacterized membrane protein
VTDDRMDQLISKLLRGGVILAAAVVLAGGIWYLASSGEAAPDYQGFHPGVRGLRALGTLPMPEALILTGLLILIATPVARVVLALAAFLLEKDNVYTGITAMVLVVLLYSIGTALW